MSIIGYGNNFNPTIDGLASFNLDEVTTNNLVVNDSVELPNGSIADAYLTTNIPKLNANNIFTGAINTFNQIEMNLNQNLTLQGSGKITQASSTSKNTLNPSEFLGEISFGPSASARINQTSNGNGALLRTLNMLGNYDIVFDAGTGKINQTNSTGINLLNSITMNSNSNISQSGTGIISQTGSSTNQLKNTTITGTFTLNAGGTLVLPANSISDSALSTNIPLKNASNTFTASNTFNTITLSSNSNINQSGSGIISQTGSSTNQLKNTTITGNLTINSGGSLILPSNSINDAALSSNVCLLNANNTFTGSINTFSTGSVELTNDSLYIRSGNGLNLFDTLTPASQSTIFVSDGNLNFENYGDMLSGSGAEGNIKFSTYNNTATFPRFKQRLNLNYDGVQVKNGVLRIYNTDETSYLQAQCDLSNSIITNYGSGGNLVLRNWNGTSTKEMVQISYTQTTFTTEITCHANINLQSTFVTPSGGQLGYSIQGVNYGLALNPLVVGTTYLKGELQNLPVGVWLIESQACFKALGAFNYTYELCIISGGGLVITFDNYKTGYFQAAATNDIFGDKVSKVIVNTAVTSYRQLFRITRQTGNASFSPLDGNTYIQATRIA